MICDDEFRDEEHSNIREALTLNGYPSRVINKVKHKVAASRPPDLNLNGNERPIKFVSAPYIRGTSEKIARVLRQFNVQLCSKATRTIKSQVCKIKDRRETLDQANVVYKLECSDCNACYVGETGRLLKERKLEHQKDVRNGSALSNVFQHTSASSHSFNFNEMKVLDREECKRKRKMLESVYTAKNVGAINRCIDLNEVYLPFLRC